MRRYRKGQTFRPPTAAESAAHADVAEAFRSRPEAPQPRLPRGVDIVKTPSGGIPAREGMVISSAICTRCVEASGSGSTKTILETDEELCVYNLDTTAVPGRIYVRPNLTIGGMLCIDRIGSESHAVIRFEVISLAPYTDDISSPCEGVVAEVLSVSCRSSGVEIGDEVLVYDPSACWFNVPMDVLQYAHGIATQMAKGDYWDVPDCVEEIDEGSCWWLVQHMCCTEELYV